MIRRRQLFGIEIDPLRMHEAVARLMQWIRDADGTCRYVVTPNVDHVVMLAERADFRSACREAGLVLTDGMPVVLASRLLRQPVPARVSGADLVPALFDAGDPARPLRVFLLGAGPGVADRAAGRIASRWPGVRVVGTDCPPLGFERDEAECWRIVDVVNAAAPDVLVLGLGAPKQELWIHRHRHQLQATVALCVGATIDFLAGEKPRAPVWMQKTGLEWCHRMASEPRRLVKRYARDAWIFPRLVLREWVRSRSDRSDRQSVRREPKTVAGTES